MAEPRIDTPAASARPEPRKPFVRPTVENLGGLTLVTLVSSIPGGG